MANHTIRPYPSASLLDFLRLAGGMAGGLARSPRSFDGSLVLRRWVQGVSARRHSDDFIVNLLFKRLLLVTGRDLTAHILEQAPSSDGYHEGPTKARAMSFLAPQALTICHDQQWRRLRSYNEQVLALANHPERQQAYLERVRPAFAGPITGAADIRRGMGRAMLGIVFGTDRAPAHLAEDVQVLFGYVQSPLRRMLLGRREKGRRERFYAALEQLWQETGEAGEISLLSLGKELSARGEYTREELLQQVPHWMFTFTGSGTDLLTRTLALVASRPRVREAVLQEISGAGGLDRAGSIGRLEYLEACLLETCRLFPPVTRTLHVSAQGDTFSGRTVPAGVEVMHLFAANQRDTQADPTADNFHPERWLDPDGDAWTRYPHLFLGGARTCPGQDLVLFVCKAAAGALLSERGLQAHLPSLAGDPVPYSFPEREARFQG
jgi:cytochrome P450